MGNTFFLIGCWLESEKMWTKYTNFTDAGTQNYYSAMVQTVDKTLLNKLRMK